MRPTLAKGARLGRYEIVEELGSGGMGVVYRAHDGDLGRDVAIKLVTVGEQPSDTLATRLVREAQALAQLSHPNVVSVYDVGRVEAGVFLAMELVEGEPGDLWIKKRPPWREVLSIFREAGRGLAAAHRVGLVHRDFKPANLIIGADGRVRVLDFGLARAANAGPNADADLMLSSSEGGSSAQERVTLPYDPSTEQQLGSSDVASWSYETTPGKARALPTPPPPSESGAPTPITERRSGPHRTRLHSALTEPPRDPNAPETTRPPERSSPTGTLLDTPLTQVGSIIGTPPYMAPEQHQGGGCNARTDQFSFCVAFYQALYGERPFAGKTYAELSKNIIEGRVRPTPAGTPVPAWIRAIVLRGLAVDPDKRWPSMDAILDALDRDPAVRRRRLGTGIGAGLVVATVGLASWRTLRGPGCGGAESELRNVWDDSRRAAGQAAFAHTNLPYAADTFGAVARALDAYAQSWVAMHVDACEATRVKATQSAELFDLRMACLGQRLDDLRAQVDLFAAADATVVARAAEAARALPPLDSCADAAALRAPVRLPEDPLLRQRIDGTRKTLATVRALWEGGRYGDAQAKLGPAVADARAIGWRPLEAEALLQSARLRDSVGDYVGASKDYRDAAVAAEAGRHDEVAALAANGLVWITGERLGKYAEARELAREAQAKIDRLDRHDMQQLDLDAKVAALYLEEGNYDEALTRAQKVLELRKKVERADDPHQASALSDVADVLVGLGRYDEAAADYQQALEMAQRAVGPDHPMCGNLHLNLGAALRASGHDDRAIEEYQKARAIIERSQGREHPSVASVEINIGGLLLDQGHAAEAAPHVQRALDIWAKALGADHPNVGTAHFRLGYIKLAEGKPQEAQAQFERTFKIWSDKFGADHPTTAVAIVGIADALLAEGKPAEAEVQYRRAQTLVEKALGSKHPELGAPLTGLGQAALALHQPKRALAPLERALTIREHTGEPLDRARTQFQLARALRESGGDGTRATQLAEAAREAFVKGGSGTQREAQEVTKWLHAR